MGIHQLFLWLKGQHFIGSLKTQIPPNISGFYLDFPGIFYSAYHKVFPSGDENKEFLKKQMKKSQTKIKEEIFEAIISELSTNFTAVRPGKKLFVGFDGSVPLAKMIQQRTRRYTREQNKDTPLETIAITPGTPFMHEAAEHIKSWLETNHRDLCEEIIFSPPSNPGEAEHKIFDYLRKPENRDEGFNVILGDDWDLLLISLLSGIKRLFLMRNTLRHFIDIDVVRESIRKLMNDSPTAIEDFAFIVLSAGGNDFLPKIESLKLMDISLDTLIYLYNTNNLPLTSEGGEQILWENVTKYFKLVAEFEKEHLLPKIVFKKWIFPSELYRKSIEADFIEANNILSKESRVVQKFDYNKFVNLRRQQNYKTLHGLTEKDKREIINYENEELSKLILVPSNKDIEEDIENQCLQYLTTAAWIYRYFLKGQNAVNETYYKYYFPPLAVDIFNFLSSHKDRLTEMKYKSEGHALPNLLFQLPIVIPSYYKSYVPNEMKILFGEQGGLSDLMPIKVKSLLEGEDKEHLSISLIPFPILENIFSSIIDKVILDNSHLNYFELSSDIIMKTVGLRKGLVIKDKDKKCPEMILKPIFGKVKFVKI
jgi:5'-3' exonuclease